MKRKSKRASEQASEMKRKREEESERARARARASERERARGRGSAMLTFTLGPRLRSLLDAALVLDFKRFLMPSSSMRLV